MNNRAATNRIFWHCTATPKGRDVDHSDLWQWHVVDNGWPDIGYHYLIQLDGTIVECRAENLVGAAVKGYNADSIHIVYAGGLTSDMSGPEDTRTVAQKEAMYGLTEQLLEKYNLTWDDVYGHNEVAAKACPSFDVNADIAQWMLKEPGDPEPNMPGKGPIGSAITDLEQRVAHLEWVVSELRKRL